MNQALMNLITSYQELNSRHVDELEQHPSPLEFMRYVSSNRPFVVRGGISQWPASERWNVEYLKNILKHSTVNVAVTPDGNADAAAWDEHRKQRYFVKPLERNEDFVSFLDYVRRQELQGRGDSSRHVRYAQTQNDNLRGEYADLYKDVEPDISWARVALDRSPDAINLWIGNSYSTTALHKDNYENLYCQVIGSKHFVLMPPSEMPCVNEQLMPAATYTRGRTEDGDLDLVPDEAEQPVPCALWDPDRPHVDCTPFSSLSQPLRVSLNPGDMLYLPTLWYHKVSQSCGEEGICCAVNYWYDMDFSGVLYPSCIFVRSITQECLQPSKAERPTG